MGLIALHRCAQIFQIDLFFKAFADMSRGLAVPNYVGEVGGGVIECCDSNAWIVGCGQERIAGTQACSHDSQPGITHLFQPIETTSNVNDSLAEWHQGFARCWRRRSSRRA